MIFPVIQRKIGGSSGGKTLSKKRELVYASICTCLLREIRTPVVRITVDNSGLDPINGQIPSGSP
jgi:hypothetical protein